MKPFAVINIVTKGLDVLDAEIAKAKILVYGDATTTEKALAQAPYRWGLSDAQAAGDQHGRGHRQAARRQEGRVRGERRPQEADPQVRGGLHPERSSTSIRFRSDLKQYGGTLTTENRVPGNGTTFGDRQSRAQEQAPTIVTKMKSAGVTTVILLLRLRDEQGDDGAGDEAGVVPGVVRHRRRVPGRRDLSVVVPRRAGAHTFGISNLSPYVQPDPTPPPPAKSLTRADQLAQLVLG